MREHRLGFAKQPIEFGRLLLALGVGYSDAQIAAAFASIDVNQSGVIDYDEFCRWWTHS